MKTGSTIKRIVGWKTLGRLIAGVMAFLWLGRWFVRLMPRAVGGEGVFAWSDLAERAHRAIER